jgi:hypothetical protein
MCIPYTGMYGGSFWDILELMSILHHTTMQALCVKAPEYNLPTLPILYTVATVCSRHVILLVEYLHVLWGSPGEMP